MHSAFCCTEATKDESETEDPSGLLGLDLLLKTSGELPLGISLRTEGTYVIPVLA